MSLPSLASRNVRRNSFLFVKQRLALVGNKPLIGHDQMWGFKNWKKKKKLFIRTCPSKIWDFNLLGDKTKMESSTQSYNSCA